LILINSSLEGHGFSSLLIGSTSPTIKEIAKVTGYLCFSSLLIGSTSPTVYGKGLYLTLARFQFPSYREYFSYNLKKYIIILKNKVSVPFLSGVLLLQQNLYLYYNTFFKKINVFFLNPLDCIKPP